MAKRGSPEWRRKLSEAKQGKKLSEEHKRKISEGIRKSITDEERKRRRIAFSGDKNPAKRPEVREKLSRMMQGNNNPMKRPEVKEQFIGDKHPAKRPEVRETLSRAAQKNWQKKEYRSKLIEAHRRKTLSKEHRKRIQESIKRYLETLSYEELIARTEAGRIAAINTTAGTSLEQAVWNVLDSLNIQYETQKRIGPFFVDIYVPSRNLVIECDGEWWHSHPDQVKYDRARDAYLLKHGYQVLRLPEVIIKSDKLLNEIERSLFKEASSGE